MAINLMVCDETNKDCMHERQALPRDERSGNRGSEGNTDDAADELRAKQKMKIGKNLENN